MVRTNPSFMFRAVRALTFCLILIPLGGAAAQTPSPTPLTSTDQSDQKKPDRDPIENADEFKSKLTLGIYFVSGAQAYSSGYVSCYGEGKTRFHCQQRHFFR